MKKSLYKLIEWLAFYSGMPGGVILALGIPGSRYKTAILISYVAAALFSLAHAARTRQYPMLGASFIWLFLDLYGLVGPGVLNV
jgi:hypothetical protein